MMRQLIVICIVIAAGACAAMAMAQMGAETLALEGGSRGVVPFPHHLHQRALGDCNACHNLFPQETGAIERLKGEGKLVKKQVMNKHGIKCHRTEKKAGKKAGPVSCAKCHQKG